MCGSFVIPKFCCRRTVVETALPSYFDTYLALAMQWSSVTGDPRTTSVSRGAITMRAGTSSVSLLPRTTNRTPPLCSSWPSCVLVTWALRDSRKNRSIKTMPKHYMEPSKQYIIYTLEEIWIRDPHSLHMHLCLFASSPNSQHTVSKRKISL